MAVPDLPDPLEPPPEPAAAAPVRRAGRAAQWRAAGQSASSGKAVALVVTILLFVAVAGGLLALFILPAPPVEPYIISIPVIEYQDHAIAPNPWAEQDADLLCGVYPTDSDNTKRNAQARGPFRQKLDEIAKLADRWKSFRKDEFDPARPFVLHVCAHAAADKGTLYILPSDARPGDPSSWVKVEDVLRAMEDCPAQKKLLVLDLARPTANPFTGPLADEAAARLHDLLANYKAKDGADRLPCVVLTACSPGEASLVMTGPRVSAFAFYLAEALRGAADGYEPGASVREKNDRVTLQEVTAFVTSRVQRWAVQTYGVTQTPAVYARGVAETDFALKLKPAPAEDPAPGKLEYAGFNAPAEWKKRDALSPAAVRVGGGELARWESLLVLADRIYAATGSTKAANDVVLEAEKFGQRAARPPGNPAPKYKSWAVAAAVLDASPATEPVKKLIDARDEYLSAAAAAPTGQPDPTLGKKKMAFDQAAVAAGPEVAALSVWRWILDATRPGRREVPPLAYLAAADATRDATFSTEGALLQAIAFGERNYRAFKLNPAIGPVKAQWLRTEETASRALLQAPDGFFWARDQIDTADKAKQTVEKQLLEFEKSDRSEGEYEAIRLRLVDVEKQFDDARARMMAAARARDAAADALRVLTATAYAAAEFDLPPADGAGGWMELADAAIPLADLIYQRPQPATVVPTKELADRADRVAGLVKAFQERWSPAGVKRRVEPGPTSPAGLRPLAADLTVPLLKADDRQRVWDTLRDAAGKFHEKTRTEQDQPENESTTRTKAAGAPNAPRAEPDRRARVSVKLLAVAGYEGVMDLAARVEAARAARTDEAWESVASGLRAAWTQQLPKEIASNASSSNRRTSRNNPWKADRELRVFPPGLSPDVARAGSAYTAAEVQMLDTEGFRNWLRGHYGAAGAIRKVPPGAGDSYRKAADETGPRPAD